MHARRQDCLLVQLRSAAAAAAAAAQAAAAAAQAAAAVGLAQTLKGCSRDQAAAAVCTKAKGRLLYIIYKFIYIYIYIFIHMYMHIAKETVL